MIHSLCMKINDLKKYKYFFADTLLSKYFIV